MSRTLEVRLAGSRVGTLTNLAGDYNLFNFDEEYLDDPAPAVLTQSVIDPHGATIRVIPRTHRVAPPFFANLLPEEDALLRRIIARQHGINRTRDFPFFEAVGLDLPGAVVVRDPEATSGGTPGDEAADAPTSEERPLRFSLAGVQLKFSASLIADRLSIPARGFGGSWIAKLPTNTFPRLPENEHTIMALAAAIGLDVPRRELFDLDAIAGLPDDLPALRPDEPRRVYAISRFDRLADGGRVHVEDFNQIAGQPPGDKYENKTTHWIANVVAALCPMEDVEEFVRRVVFGVCVGNNDMHLKNWAVTYPDGRNARLAPLYDYVCTRLYYPNAKLALTIGGENAFEKIDRAALRTLAEEGQLSVKQTLNVADETITALRDAWPAFKTTIPDPQLATALERHFTLVPLMNGR